MLLDGVHHVAVLSRDAGRLGEFYRTVFDATVGETRDHGPGETMTSIAIGPATQLNVFVIEGNGEADRQTPMWGRGRLDHLGLAAASRDAFDEIMRRLVAAGASDGQVNDFGDSLRDRAERCAGSRRPAGAPRRCRRSTDAQSAFAPAPRGASRGDDAR